MNESLVELLNRLPAVTEAGEYYELRKQDEWVCACVNYHTNGEIRNTLGATPEEAVSKMLAKLNQ
jgi:hypothetical protein